jgi:hypothetical protein
MEGKMATLTIRDFDDDLKAALRVRAVEHGSSMEAEVRGILGAALTRPSSSGIGWEPGFDGLSPAERVRRSSRRPGRSVRDPPSFRGDRS